MAGKSWHFLTKALTVQRYPVSDEFSRWEFSLPGVEPSPRRLRITRKAQSDFGSIAGSGESVAHGQFSSANRNIAVLQMDELENPFGERSTLGATSTRIATAAHITVHQFVARTIGVTTRGDGGTI